MDEEILGFFLEEAEDVLENIASSCTKLEKLASNNTFDSLCRDLHNLKGASKSVGLASIGDFVHHVEDFVIEIRRNQSLSKTQIKVLFDTHDALTEWISKLKENSTYEHDVSKIIDTINANKKEEDTEEKKDLGTILLEEEKITAEQLTDAVNQQNKKIGEILVDQGAAKTEDIEQALDKQKKQATTIKNSSETIRVSKSRIENIIQSIGELSIHQSYLMHSKNSNELETDNVKRSIDLSNKIVKELYHQALSLRMQPLSSTFKRLERVAMDVARDQEKEINVELVGEHCELDKVITEKILDPLVHVVRNAVDHGLESNVERENLQKTKTGTITLSANTEAAGVKITVKDDGKGLDPEKIKEKAIQKGLINQNTPLTEEQAFNLIFQPGFSTAEKVTNISGRGVGMDVVQAAINDLSGSVELYSKLGHGSSFTFVLPTSLTIIDALIVEINKRSYAVSLNDLLEVIDINDFEVFDSTKKGKMFNLRDEVLPLEKMDEYLPSTLTTKESDEPQIALISQWKSKKLALLVDKIIGQESIVIRNLEGHFENWSGFSGNTILSNGEPGFIMDLVGITDSYFTKYEAT